MSGSCFKLEGGEQGTRQQSLALKEPDERHSPGWARQLVESALCGHGLMRFVHPWRTNQGLWCACLAIHELGVGVLEAAGGRGLCEIKLQQTWPRTAKQL